MAIQPGRKAPKIGPSDHTDSDDATEKDEEEKEEGRLGRHDDGVVERPPQAPLRSPRQP